MTSLSNLVLAGLVAAVVLGGCTTSAAGISQPAPEPEAVNVPGELTLHEPGIGTVDRSGPACFGSDSGRFEDIRDGQVMILRSGSGEVLGRAYLEPGVWRPAEETSHPFDGDCVFAFTFVDVPLGGGQMFDLGIGYTDRYGNGVPHTRDEVLTRGVWARIEGGS